MRYYRKLNHTHFDTHFSLLQENLEASAKADLQKTMKNSKKMLYSLPLSYEKEQFSQHFCRILKCTIKYARFY